MNTVCRTEHDGISISGFVWLRADDNQDQRNDAFKLIIQQTVT